MMNIKYEDARRDNGTLIHLRCFNDYDVEVLVKRLLHKASFNINKAILMLYTPKFMEEYISTNYPEVELHGNVYLYNSADPYSWGRQKVIIQTELTTCAYHRLDAKRHLKEYLVSADGDLRYTGCNNGNYRYYITPHYDARHQVLKLSHIDTCDIEDRSYVTCISRISCRKLKLYLKTLQAREDAVYQHQREYYEHG